MVQLTTEQILPLSQNTPHIRHVAVVGHRDSGRSAASVNLISDFQLIQTHNQFRHERQDSREPPSLKPPEALLYFEDKRSFDPSKNNPNKTNSDRDNNNSQNNGDTTNSDSDNNSNNNNSNQSNQQNKSEYLISLVHTPKKEELPFNFSMMIDGNQQYQ